MDCIDAGELSALPPLLLGSHERHQSRVWHGGPGNGNYAQPVPASASANPRVQLFGKFVKRALDEARARGMSTDEIESRTGLPRSTLYRWSRAEITNPQRDLVQGFCDGLGIPRTVAAQILGWDGSTRQPTDPEPSVDPDLRAVMRRLQDPKISPAEKKTIREMLRYLARGGS